MLYRPGLQSQRIHCRQNTDAPLPGRAGAGTFPEQSEEQPRRGADATAPGRLYAVSCGRAQNLTIHDVVLHKEDTAANEEVLDAFFSGHPKATLGVVFNSRVYQVADYLQKKNLKLDALVGYDLLQKNVEHLKNGEVNYLIGQRPGLQGYCGIKALCNHVVFKNRSQP